MTVDEVWRPALAVLALAGICIAVLTLAQVHVRREVLVATGRAAVQLSLIALVIAWVFRHPEGAAGYLAVMVTVAAMTSARRVGCPAPLIPLLALAIAAGAVSALAPVLLTGALDLRAQTVLPFTAQLIGGSMTAASLTGSRMRDDVADHWGEVEAWLALGAGPRLAVEDVSRRAQSRALIPALDQTRSAGLVVLPGAFVGLLLGGASPADAAEVQLLVLVGLLAAQTVAAVLTGYVLSPWLASGRPAALR